MKPSHLSTPRTLADATFTVGYREQELQRAGDRVDVVIAVLFIVFLIGLAVGVFA